MRSIMGKTKRICDPIVWNATPFRDQPDGRVLSRAKCDCGVFIFLGTGQHLTLPRLWTDQRIRKSKRLTHADKLAIAHSELECAAETLLWHGPDLLDDNVKAELSVDLGEELTEGPTVNYPTSYRHDGGHACPSGLGGDCSIPAVQAGVEA